MFHLEPLAIGLVTYNISGHIPLFSFAVLLAGFCVCDLCRNQFGARRPRRPSATRRWAADRAGGWQRSRRFGSRSGSRAQSAVGRGSVGRRGEARTSGQPEATLSAPIQQPSRHVITGHRSQVADTDTGHKSQTQTQVTSR